ncbi:MAG: hypothetical protein KC656_05340 [Myxococcales bacterium]|nr:hypothetical protein [Myxococcales bacterium]MCB9668847.1 hypothetical protein [Alphaproteobacteria bacterium]MCB9691173.1 hypothetical protein [Alphaproteobacteria bacterium]
MIWKVASGVRADIAGYAARNLSGARKVAQLFPGGARKGDLPASTKSVVVRAVPGTRVVFAASSTDAWELASWRCVRVLEATSVPSEQKHGLPGVRIPDLDALDPFDAKRTDAEVQSGYPLVASLAEGVGWTYGGGGALAGRVTMVLVDREETDGLVLTPGEKVAMAILDTLPADAVPTALDAALAVLQHELSGADVDERLTRLEGRYRG